MGCRVDKKVSTDAPRRLAMGRWATAAMCNVVQWELDHVSAAALVDCGDGASGGWHGAGVTGKTLVTVAVAVAVAVAAMVAVDRGGATVEEEVAGAGGMCGCSRWVVRCW